MMKFRHFRLILSRSSISTAKHCNGVKKGGLFLLSLSLSLSLSLVSVVSIPAQGALEQAFWKFLFSLALCIVTIVA
jgi:hypothetical protein